jgi:putative hydrolase of the HAD superfamily
VLVNWLLFDYGNVISRSQPPEAVARLAEAARCPEPEFTAAYWEHRLAYDEAKLDGPGYWQQVGASAGRAFSGAEVARLTSLDIASWLDLNPGTVALVQDMAAAGHRLALLSNAPEDVARAVASLPIAALFEHCLFSCFLRLVKPDAAIYRAVLERLGATPADVIFLDDRQDNVASAAELGIRSVLFTEPGSARAELASLGVVAAGEAGPGSKSVRSDLFWTRLD